MYAPRGRSPSIDKVGAKAGCVLCGSSKNNQGLRLRISQDQPRGHDGAITGTFQILGVGDNKHSQALHGLLGKMTSSEEIIGIIRREYPGCVHVANTNILVLETN
jgi:hypothetical protein